LKGLEVYDMKIEKTELFESFELPSFSVPFDFDGQRLLYLQFLKKDQKKLFAFSLAEKSI